MKKKLKRENNLIKDISLRRHLIKWRALQRKANRVVIRRGHSLLKARTLQISQVEFFQVVTRNVGVRRVPRRHRMLPLDPYPWQSCADIHRAINWLFASSRHFLGRFALRLLDCLLHQLEQKFRSVFQLQIGGVRQRRSEMSVVGACILVLRYYRGGNFKARLDPKIRAG